MVPFVCDDCGHSYIPSEEIMNYALSKSGDRLNLVCFTFNCDGNYIRVENGQV